MAYNKPNTSNKAQGKITRALPPLEPYIELFLGYADDAARLCPGHLGAVLLKRDHTMRVLAEARALAEALETGPDRSFPILLAALFHDIGRFTQIRMYGTFNDGNSFNHAKESVRTLRRIDALQAVSPEKRRLITGAIFLHNVPVLPGGLGPELSLTARVLRDADKLDIVQLVLFHFEGKHQLDSGIYLNLEPHPEKYTPDMVSQVLERNVLLLDSAKYVNDYLIFLCGWIYDLNFYFTRTRFRGRAYIDRIFKQLPRTRELAHLKERLEADLLAAGEDKAAA